MVVNENYRLVQLLECSGDSEFARAGVAVDPNERHGHCKRKMTQKSKMHNVESVMRFK